MTLNHFHELDEMEQVEALWEFGVQIADRDEGEHKLILYQIDAFYVEVWYHNIMSSENTEPFHQWTYWNPILIN